VTHADAIAMLLALGTAEEDPGRPRPSIAERDATVAHLARCSDCWTALATLGGATASEAADMAARFGCESVQDDLFLLIGLDAAAIARDHAGAARHLSWCLGCRTRFAELVEVEREVATAPAWREVGDRVREAVGRLVVRIGRAATELVEIPQGFVLGPMTAPVPVRSAGGPGARAQSARFQLGETDVWGEIAIDEADEASASLALRLVTETVAPLAIHVREARAGGDALVARYTLSGTEPVVIRGLWAGSFVVEVHDTRATQVHRVRLDIGPGA
jgi:hypothetical protein